MSLRYLDYDGLTEYTSLVKAYADSAAANATPDFSGYYTSDEVDSAISSAVAGVYTVKGSCAYADLPDDAETGDVYNITDDFTLDGEDYPAGTNVVLTEDGWDALAGTYDLSAFVTSDDLADELASYVLESDLVAITTAEVDALFA